MGSDETSDHMVTCPTCGKENAPHRDRCVHCGAALSDRKAAPRPFTEFQDEYTMVIEDGDEDEHTWVPADELDEDDADEGDGMSLTEERFRDG